LFNKGIRFEEDGHERVTAGKVLHEKAYPRLDRELSPDEHVRIDRQEGDVLREIKLTSRMEDADRLQMLYYLYLYKRQGVHKTGLLSYPKEKKTVEVVLDEAGERRVKAALVDIQRVIAGSIPEFRKLPYCGKCAYKDFCFSGEVGGHGT
jgi:CRISPR-associated exonuclease Cas4